MNTTDWHGAALRRLRAAFAIVLAAPAIWGSSAVPSQARSEVLVSNFNVGAPGRRRSRRRRDATRPAS